MPESRIPELLLRQKRLKLLLTNLELSYAGKRRGGKYQTLLDNYMAQLLAIGDRIDQMGKKYNLLEVIVTYQERLAHGLTRDATGIIYLTEISKDDAIRVIEYSHPDLRIQAIKEVALKIVLPSKY